MMPKSPTIRPLLLGLACAFCLVAAAHAADEAAEELTINLATIAAKDAATILWTIAGVKSLSAADERTIVVRDTAEKLALAKAVVGMADTNDTAPAGDRLAVNDGTVIASVALKHVSARDVMAALREQVQIARAATLGEKRLFLRDTDSQIAAALDVISNLETSASH